MLVEDTELLDEATDEATEELAEELTEELTELEERLELDEDGALELDEFEELEELVAGTEHSLVPPPTRPPKVASLQVKVPVRTL